MSRFSPTVLEHAANPLNRGAMASPTIVGESTMEGMKSDFFLYLSLLDGRVERATFQCIACAPLVACGSLLTEAISGANLKTCSSFEPAHLLEKLGGLPPDKEACAYVAVNALRNAIAKHQADESN